MKIVRRHWDRAAAILRFDRAAGSGGLAIESAITQQLRQLGDVHSNALSPLDGI